MWVWEIAGCGYFGGRGGGTPLPEIFLTKNVIFHISQKFEFIGPQKFGGSVPAPIGAPSPLKFFWCSKLGLASYFQ